MRHTIQQVFRPMKWLMLLSGLLIMICGITMLFTPLENLVVIAVFLGVAMVLSGIAEIGAFCAGQQGWRSGWMLASGLVTALLGAWTMFGRGSAVLVAMLLFVFGIWVMTSSIMRIVGAAVLKAEGFAQWGWLMAFGIVGTALGFLLLFFPAISSLVISYAIALMLIAYGIDNLLIFFRMKRIGDELRESLEE